MNVLSYKRSVCRVPLMFLGKVNFKLTGPTCSHWHTPNSEMRQWIHSGGTLLLYYGSFPIFFMLETSGRQYSQSNHFKVWHMQAGADGQGMFESIVTQGTPNMVWTHPSFSSAFYMRKKWNSYGAWVHLPIAFNKELVINNSVLEYKNVS